MDLTSLLSDPDTPPKEHADPASVGPPSHHLFRRRPQEHPSYALTSSPATFPGQQQQQKTAHMQALRQRCRRRIQHRHMRSSGHLPCTRQYYLAGQSSLLHCCSIESTSDPRHSRDTAAPSFHRHSRPARPDVPLCYCPSLWLSSRIICGPDPSPPPPVAVVVVVHVHSPCHSALSTITSRSGCSTPMRISLRSSYNSSSEPSLVHSQLRTHLLQSPAGCQPPW